MPARAFRNAAAILPGRVVADAVVVCSDGRNTAVGPAKDVAIPKDAETIDTGGGFLAPGYVDLHVHGGAGSDYMDGTPEAVRAANRCHARHGTTTIFPTTTTGSPKQIDAMLHACKDVRDGWTIADGARIAGVHFYGPYFAEEKVGCHAVSGRRDPSPEEYRRAFDLGIVKIATCAAELPGMETFYCEARERGYLATCGHSNASWNEMARAFSAGMRHVDHFWCAMSSVASVRDRLGVPMQGSMEQFVLAEPEMSTEVIADGQHLAPELLRFAWRMKGAERLCLVTDANRAVDLPPGEYRFGPQEDGEMFTSDGKVGFQEGRGLASSVVGMDTMVRTMHKLAEVPLHEAVRMGSLTPAERAGVAKDVGSLEAGKSADVLVLDRDLNVRQVYIAGERFSHTEKAS